jgi:hypothetical protein
MSKKKKIKVKRPPQEIKTIFGQGGDLGTSASKKVAGADIKRDTGTRRGHV